MKQQCEYCDFMIDDTDEVCSNCGAPNEHVVRAATGVPQTIEELKAFCAEKNLPLEKMRFFIGEDYKEPKAFGIFEDAQGDFVVYKNKADGSRAIRYEGKDESYAVNEIYQKLKAEINERRAKAPASIKKNSGSNSKGPKKPSLGKILLIIFAILFAFFILSAIFDNSPSRGYYTANDRSYYYTDGDWYLYDDYAEEWTPIDDPYFYDDWEDYYESSSYDDSYGSSDFSDSDYWDSYESDNNWDDDWDDDDWGSDYDWDSGDSWDSGGDWDSDW